MSSSPNPFASDSSGLRAMLQAVFSGMPQAPALEQMALPNWSRPTQDPIDLGAGGPPPGSPRQNGLTALGGGLQGLSGIIGGAMAANQAANAARGQEALDSVGVNSGGFKPGQNPLDSLQYSSPGTVMKNGMPIATTLGGKYKG